MYPRTARADGVVVQWRPDHGRHGMCMSCSPFESVEVSLTVARAVLPTVNIARSPLRRRQHKNVHVARTAYIIHDAMVVYILRLVHVTGVVRVGRSVLIVCMEHIAYSVHTPHIVRISWAETLSVLCALV